MYKMERETVWDFSMNKQLIVKVIASVSQFID